MSAPTKDTVELVREAKAGPASQRVSPSAHTAAYTPSDAVCMEIPVRISGSRIAAIVRGITEYTEPFQEDANTLIVFPLGAVVRLAADVKAGQLLNLANQRTGQEALCRVVNVRACANMKSYVALEFSRRAPGFWGLNFASDAAQPSASSAVPTAPAERGRTQAPMGAISTVCAAAQPGQHEISGAPSPTAGNLRGVAFPPETPSRASEPPSRSAPARQAEMERPVALTSIVDVAAPRGAGDMGVAAPYDPPSLSSPSDVSGAPGSSAASPTARERVEIDQPVEPTSAAHAAIQILEGPRPVASPASSEETVREDKRPTLLTYGKSSLPDILGTRLDQEIAAGQQARERQPSRTLFFSLAGVAVVLVLAAAMFFLRRESGSMGETTASSGPVTAPMPAPPEPALRPEPTPPTSAAETQTHPSASIVGQPSTQAQTSPTPGTVPREIQAPVESRRTVGAFGNVTPRPAVPEKRAMPAEEAQPSVVLGGDSEGAVSETSRSSLFSTGPGASKAQPPIPIGGHVQPPRLLASVAPTYPLLAKQSRVEGDVTIQAEIDPMGKVVGMKVVSGHPLLHQAAMDALRQWKYEPSKLNGEAVSSGALVTVKFRLK